jgi:voltage-gated potassium channel
MCREDEPVIPDEPSELNTPPNRDDHEQEQSERWELLGHIQALLEPVMVVLGLIFLVLLFIDYGGVVTGTEQELLLSRTMLIIWGIFLTDFLLRLTVAPDKFSFVKVNWLTIISLALPFLRPVRALRALRAVRSINLVRLLGGVNRGMRIVRRVSRGHQFAYVGGLTILVVIAGAVGVWFFDRGAAGATILTFGDAIWWSSTLITTVSNEQYPVTTEARILALLMRIYAVSVFGFITATIASYLVGQRFRPHATEDAPDLDLDEQLASLRRELQSLRQELRDRHESSQEGMQA